jgi:SAM-dependent methyltransferase
MIATYNFFNLSWDSLFNNIRYKTDELNRLNILSLIDYSPEKSIVDLGCDNGSFTKRIANKIGSNKIYGIDLSEKITDKSITLINSDLNGRVPLDDKSIDIVHSNQVIEHLRNPDFFLREIHRILKDDGYAIISTENLSSWHNILALLLGWQPFSLTNVSEVISGLGNPLGACRNTRPISILWSHIHVFAYQGLRELCCANDFKITKSIGSGYYPLPAYLGKINPRHAALITLKLAKK